MWIGAHLSISQGFLAAVETALALKGNTFQFFTRNPRGGKARALDQENLLKAQQLMREHNFGPVVAHAPYTYNLASAKKNVRAFSRLTLQKDLLRIKQMGVPYLVLHVGSHGGQGEKRGLALVIEGLSSVLSEIADGLTILLESMAGQGTELGYTFEHLAQVIQGCEGHPGLGVCLDSCHLTGAGYDLTKWTTVKKEFSQIVGGERLKAFHLNDSLQPLASRKDRHAKLGEGYLGLEVLATLVNDPDLQKVPLILETPQDLAGYAREIALVKKMV